MGTRSLKRLFSRAVPAESPIPNKSVCCINKINTAGIKKAAKPFVGLNIATSSYSIGIGGDLVLPVGGIACPLNLYVLIHVERYGCIGQ